LTHVSINDNTQSIMPTKALDPLCKLKLSSPIFDVEAIHERPFSIEFREGVEVTTISKS
jgi:hypothetical protein